MRPCISIIAALLLLSGGLAPVDVEPPGSLGGAVRDHHGGPLAGARIELRAPRGEQASTETDASGEYRLDGLPPGDGYILTVSSPCYVKVEVSPLEVRAADLTLQNLDLTLRLHTSSYYMHLALPPADRESMREDVDWIASLLCVPGRAGNVRAVQLILDWIAGLPPKLAAGNHHALQECLLETVAPDHPLLVELLDSDDPERQELGLELLWGWSDAGAPPPPGIRPLVERLLEPGVTRPELRELAAGLLQPSAG